MTPSLMQTPSLPISGCASLLPCAPHHKPSAQPLLDLLLWSELVGVSTLLLTAVGGSRWQTGVALSADHLLAVVLGGKSLEGGLDDTATETEDKVER